MVRGLSGRILIYLQLVRFPNLFTAAADIFAGYFIVHGSRINGADLLLLSLASVCIYAGGCVLNDLVDRELDAVERPFRPIPSGRVSLPKAWNMLLALFGTGLLLAFPVGTSALLIAAVLILSVLSYDLAARKRDFYGPLNMAACRSLNLLLGMSTGLQATGETVFFPLLTLLYVFSLTTLSRFEVEGTPGSKRWLIAICWGAVVTVIVGLWLGGRFLVAGLVWLAVFVCWTGPRLLLATVVPTPQRAGMAVKAMILGIPLLDAVYTAGIQGFLFGLIVALFIVPANFLARHVYVT